MTDEPADLLARIALGERAAFATLYEQTSAKLFGVCLRILGNRSEAEEALQDIYIKIWHRADRFRAGPPDGEGAGAMGWLVAIARHHAIDVRRTRKPPAEDVAARTDLAADLPDPETHAAAGDTRRRLAACLAELEARRAEAVRRAYIEGDSYRELAARFEVPLNTMRTWLRRSLARLKQCLDAAA